MTAGGWGRLWRNAEDMNVTAVSENVRGNR